MRRFILLSSVIWIVVILFVAQLTWRNSSYCVQQKTKITSVHTVTRTVTVQPESYLSKPSPKAKIPIASKEFSDWNTTVRCMELPDFSGICEYEYLCYDGTYSLMFLQQDLEIGNVLPISTVSSMLESRYRLPLHFPPPFPEYVPYGDSHFYPYLKKLHPNTLDKQKIQFINGTVWIAKAETTWKNPYYFMKDTSQLRDAQWWNQSAQLQFPPMDYVFLIQQRAYPGWGEDMVPFLVQPHSQVFIQGENLLSHFNYPSVESPICFERGMVVGDKPQYWSGMSSSHDFRTSILDYLNLPQDKDIRRRQLPREKNFVPKVLICNRNGARTIENIKELVDVLQYYRLSVLLLQPFLPGTDLRSQAEYFRNTDVYIIVHGAGEVNNLFLPEGASVIEIFPYGMKNMLFERHAKHLGLNYFPVRSWIKSQNLMYSWTVHMDYFHNVCQNQSNFENNDNNCVHAAKNAATFVPLREFEEAVLESFWVQGLDIRRRVKLQQRFTVAHPDKFYENDSYHPMNHIHPLLGNESFLAHCYTKGINHCYTINT